VSGSGDGTVEYLLTDKGKSLGPIVNAMREWGTQHR
jgi:DNA-binding HxlR family transcriptional regulator